MWHKSGDDRSDALQGPPTGDRLLLKSLRNVKEMQAEAELEERQHSAMRAFLFA